MTRYEQWAIGVALWVMVSLAIIQEHAMADETAQHLAGVHPLRQVGEVWIDRSPTGEPLDLGDEPPRDIDVTWAQLNIRCPREVADLWQHRSLGQHDKLLKCEAVPSHGVAFARLSKIPAKKCSSERITYTSAG